MELHDILYAIFIGALQGVTEFLPISSSAHLIIVSWFVKGEAMPLSLNVSLHLGTVLAVLCFFLKDWLNIAKGTLTTTRWNTSKRLLTCLVIGSVPAGIIGLLFKDQIEGYLHHPLVTVLPLMLVGVLLWLVDKYSKSNRNINNIGVLDAIIIGCCQAVALIPGVSRSGITILGSRSLKINRTDAARFSFLLGTPAMLGAAVLDYKDILAHMFDPIFIIGVISAFVVGFFTIGFLLNLLKRFGFFSFAIYRIFIAVVIIVLQYI